MADIAKRAGKEDGRSHRGRGADITKRAGSADNGNGRRRHRRGHKGSARPPTPAEVAVSAPTAAAPKPAPVIPAAAKPAPAVKPVVPAAAELAPAAKSTSIAPAAVAKPAPAPTEAKPAPAESTTVKADPATLDLTHLFNNPAMFESRATWQAAGFTIIAGKNEGEILVASHPSAPGILFKKFTAAKSAHDQLRNYQTRIEGARKLRAFVAANHLERIVVPRKWIQQLPGPVIGHILVEDRVDVLTRSATQEAYENLEDRTLRDLCVVVRAFPGLDSGARNMLLTKDGKIAFIDTERWDEKRDRDHDRPGLRHIQDHLSDKQRKSVQKIFQQLDEA